MRRHLPQQYFGRLWRAIIEFDMIAENDRILIGLSGGKDSVFLTYALSIMRDHSPRKFELAAITLDPMFSTNFDTTVLAEFCASLNVPFHTFQVDIAGIIAKNDGKDPCFSCSFFRRGAINKFARENSFNKIAYAHHHDDAVETFLMSILYSGQIKTFLPKTYLDRTDLTVIRPLIYFRERELRASIKYHGFTPLRSPCPIDGQTKRQEIKDMISSFERQNPMLYSHLSSAMRQEAIIELWPSELPRDVMQKKHFDFWKAKYNKPE